MRFFLGTHHPGWLARTRVPLYVSHHSLQRLLRLPRLVEGGTWALDSGGFTELSQHGRWRFTAREYATAVRRYHDEIGPPAHIAQMDWMCEEQVRAKTGLTVSDHQRATIDNFLELRDLEPDLPWVPVLQGHAVPDYGRHLRMWASAGIDLRDQPLVGLGSICRKQNVLPITLMISRLAAYGLKLHAYGFATQGLIASAPEIVSSDSLSWSRAARWEGRNPGHEHEHCGNCLPWALSWRSNLLDTISHQHPGIVADLDLLEEAA